MTRHELQLDALKHLDFGVDPVHSPTPILSLGFEV